MKNLMGPSFGRKAPTSRQGRINVFVLHRAVVGSGLSCLFLKEPMIIGRRMSGLGFFPLHEKPKGWVFECLEKPMLGGEEEVEKAILMALVGSLK